MITGIDHIALETPDAGRAARELGAVLGRTPKAESSAGGARLQLDSMAVVVSASAEAPHEGAPAAMRLVLATPDLDKCVHRLTRRGLPGAKRADGGVFDLDQSATRGVPIGLAAAGTQPPRDATADISGLDHVVIQTPDPERAVALYGGRLGLDLRLDRTNPDFGTRFLFFVCGGLVIEITHDLRKGTGSGRDHIWGLAWRANDLERAHARMTAAGVGVSELREGRRPGTRVFTVKSHTAGVPTLVIAGAGLERT
jgi:catechol 2,3-dioxygenase-like lactoylglutathione lyase family enzyme